MKSGNDHTKRIPSSASTDEKLGNNRHHQNDVEADEPLKEWAVRFSDIDYFQTTSLSDDSGKLRN